MTAALFTLTACMSAPAPSDFAGTYIGGETTNTGTATLSATISWTGSEWHAAIASQQDGYTTQQANCAQKASSLDCRFSGGRYTGDIADGGWSGSYTRTISGATETGQFNMFRE